MPHDRHQPHNAPITTPGSYPAVSGDALRLLALLAGYPGSRVSTEVAAAAFGMGVSRAAGLLAELSRNGLVEPAKPGPGSCSGYYISDFVVAQALDPQVPAGVPVMDRQAMLTRVARMLLRLGVAADRSLDPFRSRVGPRYTDSLGRPSSAVEAAEWIVSWRGDLIAVQAAAFAVGLDAEVWQLAEVLISAGERFLTPASREVFDRAATAAERLGDTSVRCRMTIAGSMHRRKVGLATVGTEPDGWRAYADRLCTAVGSADVITYGWCLRELGQACLHHGSYQAALSHLSRARDVLATRGAGHEAAITRWSIAEAHSAGGHDAKAIPELQLAATAFRRWGDLGRSAVSQVRAAYAFHRLGRGSDALTWLDGCIPVLRDTCFPREQALAHALYAALHPHRDHAARHAVQARELTSRLHLPLGNPLHELLE